MRIDRYLSNNGFGSRKSVKKLFHRGEIKVNGVIVTDSDFEVRDSDVIEVGGERVIIEPHVNIMLNKPEGYISSLIDERYPSVLHLIPERYQKRVRIVGRLDNDTTGLLLLTDDGPLNNRLASPKSHIPKTYEVRVNHVLKPGLIDIFREGGIDIGGGDIAASSTLVIRDEYEAEITVYEGKYHEIKRLFGRFNYDVIALNRRSLGPLSLDIEVGKWRLLSDEEYQSLLDMTHLRRDALKGDQER